MAIVNCPACHMKLKVAGASVNKKVKCACGHVFVAAAEGGAPVPIAAEEKMIVECTECGSKVKVAGASLGNKMKCPKCAAVFVANVPVEAPQLAVAAVAPADDDDQMTFAQAEAPILAEDDEPEQPRPVPAKAGAKKYPSRFLVNLTVFFLLALFIGVFAAVFLFMEDESMIEPKTTNRKYLEGFGWPNNDANKKNGPRNNFDKGMRPNRGKGRKQDDKNKVIADGWRHAVPGMWGSFYTPRGVI